MRILKNHFLCLTMFVAALLASSATVWAAPGESKARINPSIESGNIQLAEINQFEKFIFDKERGDLKDPKRKTWEGILDSDSADRKACKQACLNGYGVDARSQSGDDCDQPAWNKCMQLMEWGFMHWHRTCKGEHKAECEACWQRQTEACYDNAFHRCVETCPK